MSSTTHIEDFKKTHVLICEIISALNIPKRFMRDSIWLACCTWKIFWARHTYVLTIVKKIIKKKKPEKKCFFFFFFFKVYLHRYLDDDPPLRISYTFFVFFFSLMCITLILWWSYKWFIFLGTHKICSVGSNWHLSSTYIYFLYVSLKLC